jgi:DNA-binding LacI/PurR family transcriptional regulator
LNEIDFIGSFLPCLPKFLVKERLSPLPITITDVAREANVSRATVSRVISRKPITSEDVRTRVLAAIEKLGYQPNLVARSLRVQQSKIIGLIISDIQNPFYTGLVRAVEDTAYKNNFLVFLCNSDEDIEKEILYLKLMIAEKVAGVVITPTQERDNPAKILMDAGVPVVAVDRSILDLDVDSVVVDNYKVAYELVDHLISDGHRRIAIVAGPSTITTSRERLEGYSQALVDHDLKVEPKWICQGLPKEEYGYRAVSGLLALKKPPDALFLVNNLLTLGALRAIREKCLRIPEDIALVAFDEINWTSFVNPPLTVAIQPTYELGRKATELLINRIKDPTLTKVRTVINASIFIQKSCSNHSST